MPHPIRSPRSRLLRFMLCAIGVYIVAVFLLSLIYMLISPPSTLMLTRWMTFQHVERTSVPLKKINRNLVRAVISAEDDRFCKHWGVDWNSMGNAIEQAGSGERSAGASTISMQVAKNLFLWLQRSYVRKSLEIPLALYLDLIWSKKHMLEVYLSIAEWGDGIFGIEAASQAYFNKPASSLNADEAALLAAALPNPLDRNPAWPSHYHRTYANKIMGRVYSGVDTSCL